MDLGTAQITILRPFHVMSSAADKLKKERGRKYAKDNYDKN